MSIPKIEVKRSWNRAAMESLFNEHKVLGTVYGDIFKDHYERMLAFVDTHEPTYENLYRVALDVYNHSENKTNSVAHIMSLLEQIVVTTDFEVASFNPFDFNC